MKRNEELALLIGIGGVLVLYWHYQSNVLPSTALAGTSVNPLPGTTVAQLNSGLVNPPGPLVSPDIFASLYDNSDTTVTQPVDQTSAGLLASSTPSLVAMQAAGTLPS